MRAFFEQDLGLELVREDTGKLFPRSNKARDVLEALLASAAAAGAEIRTGFRLRHLRPGEPFELESDRGDVLRARRVVLATGGLSVPKTGSDGFILGNLQKMSHLLF